MLSSSSTNRSPVEDPIKIFTPQQPEKLSNSLISSIFSLVAPIKKLKLQKPLFSAILNLLESSLRFVVGGLVFGISKIEVTPPKTAPIVP